MGSILLGPFPFLAVMMLVYILGTRELSSLYKPARLPFLLIAASGAAFLPLTLLFFHSSLGYLWFFLPMSTWFLGYIWSGFRLPALLALFWLALPLSSFLALGWLNQNAEYANLLPLSVIVLVWVNDTFAYIVGSLAGKHQMTPVLSPGKTWEGSAGGVLFTMFGGWVIWRITGSLDTLSWILTGMCTGLLGLLGDLFESHLKRSMHVKNTGAILPGHGGILDRFDSLLFVAPASLLMMVFLKVSL